MMLHVAYVACKPEELSALSTVFASRYGEMPLTASAFTHSVHNTQVVTTGGLPDEDPR